MKFDLPEDRETLCKVLEVLIPVLELLHKVLCREVE
jgi:hypothetical protein